MFQDLFPGKKAIIVADRNTWEVAGKDVLLSLQEAGVPHDEPFIFTDPDLYAEWTYVEQLKARLSETDAIPIAVGSGVINDLTKYVAFLLGRRYMTVGTAASMDGYTAYGSSITIDGNKQTVDCPAPYGFVMDPVIAAEAPKELAASGYGDLIAKIPAGADWMLAEAAGVEAGPGRPAGVPGRSGRRARRRCLLYGKTLGRAADERLRHAGVPVQPPGFRHGAPVLALLGHGESLLPGQARLARIQGQYRDTGFHRFPGVPA